MPYFQHFRERVATWVATHLHGRKECIELISCHLDLRSVHMSINIRGHLDVGMAHKLLSGPNVYTGFGKVGAIGMPEAVWDEILCKGERRL